LTGLTGVIALGQQEGQAAVKEYGALNMDFIEAWFGVSPDGGDGSLEVLWIAAIVIAVLIVAFRRHVVRWLSSWWTGQSDTH